jgi:hypothetical protein
MASSAAVIPASSVSSTIRMPRAVSSTRSMAAARSRM